MSQEWFEAIKDGKISVVREMVDLNPDWIDRVSSKQRSALHLAAKHGQIEIMELVLNRGTSMWKISDAKLCMPIHLAVIYGQVDTIECLVNWFERQIAPTLKPYDSILHGIGGEHILFQLGGYLWTPFIWAARKNQVQSLRTIVRLGQQCEQAAIERFGGILPEGIELLRWKWQPEIGSWVDQGDCDAGNTAFHVAAIYGKVDAIRALVQLKADPLIFNDTNQTAIHCAAEHGQSRVIEVLVDFYGPELIIATMLILHYIMLSMLDSIRLLMFFGRLVLVPR